MKDFLRYLPICICLCVLAQASFAQIQFNRMDTRQGLSHNQVNTVFKDDIGFIWIGSPAGLNRFDGYTCKVFRHKLNDSASLSDDNILEIQGGPGGLLWIRTLEGFNLYDPKTEQINRHPELWLQENHLPTQNLRRVVKLASGYAFIYDASLFLFKNGSKEPIIYTLPSGKALITDITQDQQLRYWLVFNDGSLGILDANLQHSIRNTGPIHPANPDYSYRLFIDHRGNGWFYASGTNTGAWFYDANKDELKNYSDKNTTTALNNNLINGIVEDDKGDIWLGTDHGGINIIHPSNGEIRYVTNHEDDEKSLSQNSVTCMYKDREDMIWVGTFKRGVNFYSKNILKFPLYKHSPNNAKSLPYNDVNRFVEDHKGNLWIGTNGGGLIYFNRETQSFTRYKHQPGNSNSLANDVIVSMCLDHSGQLWIGTYYGGLDRFDGKTFTHFKHDPMQTGSISDDRVWEIYEDKDHRIWVGTLTGGLNRYDPASHRFQHFKSGPGSIQSNYIAALMEDHKDQLWIGTSTGIDVYNKKTGVFRHLGAAQKLSNENVISILKDSRDHIWVGTRDGLNLWDDVHRTFRVFRQESGLPSNMILNILEDSNGRLWLSTPNGISKIKVQKNTAGDVSIHCNNFDERDGLQGREFNENAALTTSKGELVFGGPNGFNIVDPLQTVTDASVPPIAFTELQLFNNNIQAGDTVGNRILLKESLPATHAITLKHNENVFAISFAALGYANASKHRYAFKLEGFHEDWLSLDQYSRRASFTNLDPGNYTLKVRFTGENGEWHEAGQTLGITILPPFWKTGWAYTTYGILLIIVLWVGRQMIINRAHRRFALEQERKEAQRTHDLDMMKIKFFTNVSHEFRTPLSLILSPLEKILQNVQEQGIHKQLSLVQRNAKRLLNLVNQLLDFRKMEVQELKIQPSKGDLAAFIYEVCISFNDIADNKKIQFSYHTDVTHLYTSFDHDKIERICFNILSNAFKFTLPGGQIKVNVQRFINGEQEQLLIQFTDTGIGMEAGKIDKIFDRFYQEDMTASVINQGSGIGLAITKEFVKLCGGSISVASEPGRGSTFSVYLPFKEIVSIDAEPAPTPQEATSSINVKQIAANKQVSKSKQQKTSILIVEDNDDFRFYLKDNLQAYFHIIEACNGKEGWQKILSQHPALVVSDVSMPEMNGLDLCKKIKNDTRTQQVPVILLTALSEESQQVEGLASGANDYITKPFSFEILHSKIKNVIAQQNSLKKTYSKQVEAKPTELDIVSPDEQFVQQALSIIEKHLGDPDFSVEILSKELFMSRVAVYKKLYALTGKPPLEFIRSIRLQHAAQLLEKSRMTVAEVAYEVGFNNPKYFSKYFKATYQLLPKEYIAEYRKLEAGIFNDDEEEV